MLAVLILTLMGNCTSTVEVAEVIDGDTFRTTRGETIRLLGVNAPETGDPGADIAQEALTRLILHAHVRLVPDQTDQDAYGRSLRYVFCRGLFINQELVRLGYTETRFYPPDTLYRRVIQETERHAVRNRRGLWAFAVFQPPDTLGLERTAPALEPAPGNVVSWKEAASFYGQVKTVEGRVVVSKNTGKVCFLNFHKDWKTHFTVVIFAGDFNQFPPHPEDYYLNRRIRVTGLIQEYKGKPEIVAKSADQIKVVD